MNYRVAKDRGILTPQGRALQPLTPIDVQLFDKDRICRLLASGFIEEYEPAKQEPPKREGRTGKVTPGPWMCDPDMLEPFTLEELNVMVLERDPNMEPFETREEAITQLSEDFVNA